MNSHAPPQQLAYPSSEEARAAIDAQAHLKGYVVVVNAPEGSAIRRMVMLKLYFLFARIQTPLSYAHMPDPASVCPPVVALAVFTASIRRREAGDWLLQVAKDEHNHEPFTHPSAHPHGRTMTRAAGKEVLALTRAGVKPGRIVTLQRENNNALATAQYICNLRHAERTRILAGCSPLLALLDNLAASDYFSQVDYQQQLTHLLLISPSAKEICQKYSAGRVWLINATYKTNR